MRRRRGWAVGAGGLTLAMLCFVWCVLGVGQWSLQAHAYMFTALILSAAPAWLAWQGARRTTLRGARRFCWISTLAWTFKTIVALYGAARTLTVGNVPGAILSGTTW